MLKGQARAVPFETAERDRAARLAFGIGHQPLVAQIEHDAIGQDIAPMVHERSIGTVVAPKLRQIIGEGLIAGEEKREKHEKHVSIGSRII